MNSTFLNIHQNFVGALAYVFGPFTGLICFIGEGVKKTNNKYVKFHALQSTIVFLAAMVIRFVLDILPFMGLFHWAFDCVTAILWVYLIYMAFSGKEFKVPIIGDVCREKVYNM